MSGDKKVTNDTTITEIVDLGNGVIIDRRAGEANRVLVDGKVVGTDTWFTESYDRAVKELSKKSGGKT